MGKTPFFSIIIPTYNRAGMIGTAIESVIAQSYKDWELIIVDDGSTDTTKDVVESFGDSRIMYYWQENQERSAARNNGINKANGKWICFLDSDDYYQNHLEVFSSIIASMGNTPRMFYASSAVLERNDFNVYERLIKSIVHSQQVCIHSEILKEMQFDEHIKIGEDVELWMRIAKKFPVEHIAKNTVEIVQHEDRSVNFYKTNSFKDGLSVFQKIFKSSSYPSEISKYVKQTIYSDCCFGIAKYHIFQKQRCLAVWYIIKSILAYPNRQLKHKLLTLATIPAFIERILNIKNEYKTADF